MPLPMVSVPYCSMQKTDTGEWQPVAYASRSMRETEMRYAQIEKEALATTWACERFSDYILGKTITIETDHKPLVPLLSTKHLDNTPPRVLRFRLRLMRFDYSIIHIPGKLLYAADTLSRAPQTHSEEDLRHSAVTEAHISAVVSQLPASEDRLDIYRNAQADDPTCSQIMSYCANGWPERHRISGKLKHYWQARHDLTIGEDLLLYQSRIVVPESLQHETLHKIHQGHQAFRGVASELQHQCGGQESPRRWRSL